MSTLYSGGFFLTQFKGQTIQVEHLTSLIQCCYFLIKGMSYFFISSCFVVNHTSLAIFLMRCLLPTLFLLLKMHHISHLHYLNKTGRSMPLMLFIYIGKTRTNDYMERCSVNDLTSSPLTLEHMIFYQGLGSICSVCLSTISRVFVFTSTQL